MLVSHWKIPLFFGTLLLLLSNEISPIQAQSNLYNPLILPLNRAINDRLSAKDIPTGEGGFARDYQVNLQKGDQVSIDVKSEDFDSIVLLIASDGTTVAENDDGPDGTTNSLLFTRITESGRYIIRVRAFGKTGGGRFTLKLTRLQPVEEN
ncbi:MAG: PPC domain-containing protein [Halothece sp. Uz-M2-17]|nr:PPC domain-containing protein [Halothece sp. Uz-M2-17]